MTKLYVFVTQNVGIWTHSFLVSFEEWPVIEISFQLILQLQQVTKMAIKYIYFIMMN